MLHHKEYQNNFRTIESPEILWNFNEIDKYSIQSL